MNWEGCKVGYERNEQGGHVDVKRNCSVVYRLNRSSSELDEDQRISYIAGDGAKREGMAFNGFSQQQIDLG